MLKKEEKANEMFYSITGLRAKRLHFMEEFFFQPHRIIASEMQSYFGPAQFYVAKTVSGTHFACKTEDDSGKKRIMFPSNQKFQSKMVFEAAELPQRGLAIQIQKSLTSNPINADKGLVVD